MSTWVGYEIKKCTIFNKWFTKNVKRKKKLFELAPSSKITNIVPA